ncbi:aldo/keto reductase [Streptomyces sp. NPDC087769]|uniref:aldo/keto reductase n=1 Tax=Streptomyces sp. NPDC087769 TaxID=3365802 RepID=UPI00381DF6A3
MKLRLLRYAAITLAAALAAALGLTAPAHAGEPGLPRLNITDTYVTGISSGGFMASPLQVAYSGTFKGAGIVAAGPYYCGKGGMITGLIACGTGLISTDPEGIEQIARRWSAEGRIDPVSNLAGKPVYTYHGTKDPLVRTSVSDEGVRFYGDFGARTAYHDTDPAGHGWPAPNAPLSCGTTFYPFLINCGNDLRFQGENFTANTAAASVVREVAERQEATPAQIARAWLLHRGEDIVPIPGTKRRVTLEENLAAVDVVLDAEDLRQLDEALPPEAVAGTRYPEAVMHMNGR